jgi:Ser/Thr protein kinase RdoA (MazF antagonist)/predicted kinase
MPRLIVMTGLPGTGKSSIAKALGRELGIPVFAKDWLEAALRRSGFAAAPEFAQRLGYAGYELLSTLADQQLRLGQSAVLDSVASTDSIRSAWRELAAAYSAGWCVIECVCSDLALHRERLLSRERWIPDWPELEWAEVERVQSYYAPWREAHLILDAVHPLQENIDRALRYLLATWRAKAEEMDSRMRHDNDDAHDILPLLDAYPLTPPIECLPAGAGGKNNHMLRVRTGAGNFYVRGYTSLSYTDPATIAFENDVLLWLSGRSLSFAIPVPIPTSDGRIVSSNSGRRIALTPQLPGAPLDPTRLGHAGLLGAVAGELQTALRGHPATPRPGRSLFGDLLRFALPTCDPLTLRPRDLGHSAAGESDALCARWREEAAALQSFVETVYGSLPTQLCHNDVTHNNVLAENGHIRAALDFEFATVTPRALDLVQGLRLSMRILDGPDPLAAARRFMRGFRRWRSLTEAEVQTLPQLIRLRTALTVVWWLAHLPESRNLIPDRLRMVDKTASWIDRNGEHLIETVAQELLA